MKRKLSKKLISLLTLLSTVFCLIVLYNNCGNKSDKKSSPGNSNTNDPIIPVVFLHGFQGDEDTFIKFISLFKYNGYPDNKIKTFRWQINPEFNFGNNLLKATDEGVSSIIADLDALINTTIKETNSTQVDIITHSLSCDLGYIYLENADRRKKIRKFVHIDRTDRPSLPGPKNNALKEVLNIITDDHRKIEGAHNTIYDGKNHNGQTLMALDHNQVASHGEVFKKIFQFLNPSKAPSTNRTLNPKVNIAGRLINFATGKVIANFPIKIYQVDSLTGATTQPVFVETTSKSDGKWGPITLNSQNSYMILLQETTGSEFKTLKYYFENFKFSTDYLTLRLIPNDNSNINSIFPSTGNSAHVTIFSASELITGTSNGQSELSDEVFINYDDKQQNIHALYPNYMHLSLVTVYYYDPSGFFNPNAASFAGDSDGAVEALGLTYLLTKINLNMDPTILNKTITSSFNGKIIKAIAKPVSDGNIIFAYYDF